MAITSSPADTSDGSEALPQVRPLLVTVAQAAEILCLSRSSIYQLIWNDELQPIRIGRSIRFSIEQLERFVDQRSADLTD